MAVDKCGAERKCQQRNERDGGQSAVGDGLALTFWGGRFGAVATGVEKTMLESPILSQIVPPVVLLLPAEVTQPAHQHGGEGFGITQSGIPEPFVFSGFRFQLAVAGRARAATARD